MTLLNHPSWRVSPRTTACDGCEPLIVIVSDVDGTLLDANGKLPAPPAFLRGLLVNVGRAHASRVALALASSRTLAELLVLQRVLGIAGPCIAEDGGMIAMDEFLAGSSWSTNVLLAGTRRLRYRRLGASHRELRTVMTTALSADEETSPRDLGLLDSRALASLGFRTSGNRRRAIQRREASVLFDVSAMTEPKRALLSRAASDAGATLHSGGRWHTLTRDAGKGGGVALMRTLLSDHDTRESQGTHSHDKSARDAHDCSVVAIGNDENDASMLAVADQGFAIHNPGRGPHPALLAVRGTQTLSETGAAGFVEMLELLAQPVSVR